MRRGCNPPGPTGAMLRFWLLPPGTKVAEAPDIADRRDVAGELLLEVHVELLIPRRLRIDIDGAE